MYYTFQTAVLQDKTPAASVLSSSELKTPISPVLSSFSTEDPLEGSSWMYSNGVSQVKGRGRGRGRGKGRGRGSGRGRGNSQGRGGGGGRRSKKSIELEETETATKELNGDLGEEINPSNENVVTSSNGTTDRVGSKGRKNEKDDSLSSDELPKLQLSPSGSSIEDETFRESPATQLSKLVELEEKRGRRSKRSKVRSSQRNSTIKEKNNEFLDSQSSEQFLSPLPPPAAKRDFLITDNDITCIMSTSMDMTTSLNPEIDYASVSSPLPNLLEKTKLINSPAPHEVSELESSRLSILPFASKPKPDEKENVPPQTEVKLRRVSIVLEDVLKLSPSTSKNPISPHCSIPFNVIKDKSLKDDLCLVSKDNGYKNIEEIDKNNRTLPKVHLDKFDLEAYNSQQQKLANKSSGEENLLAEATDHIDTNISIHNVKKIRKSNTKRKYDLKKQEMDSDTMTLPNYKKKKLKKDTTDKEKKSEKCEENTEIKGTKLKKITGRYSRLSDVDCPKDANSDGGNKQNEVLNQDDSINVFNDNISTGLTDAEVHSEPKNDNSIANLEPISSLNSISNNDETLENSEPTITADGLENNVSSNSSNGVVSKEETNLDKDISKSQTDDTDEIIVLEPTCEGIKKEAMDDIIEVDLPRKRRAAARIESLKEPGVGRSVFLYLLVFRFYLICWMKNFILD